MKRLINQLEITSTQPYVVGNLYLPSALDGYNISWLSSNPDVIDPTQLGDLKAGIVTRGIRNEEVKLTAIVSDGINRLQKEYDVIVKAKPVGKTEEDMKAYLFVTFKNEEAISPNAEQIYFSVSRDGYNWEELNSSQPVLVSIMGDQGVRDPYILRSQESDKFYIIATDLSTFHYNDWHRAKTEASQSIMIWESEDLVNWSEQRMIKVGPEGAGNVWAPESVYDIKTGDYMVFWASTCSSDNYVKHRIYESRTRDFINFTAPRIYMEADNDLIDSTLIENSGKYYRFTHGDDGVHNGIIMQESDTVDGEFTHVKNYTLSTLPGYEGPSCYKINGQNKWCLLVDHYVEKAGYQAFEATDLKKGNFVPITSMFNTPYPFRHGSILPITLDEYDAIKERYPNNN